MLGFLIGLIRGREYVVHFPMQPNQFLLYGANGYTGRLIAQLAADYNLNPILAGRNKKAIQQLSEELRLPYRIIDLDDAADLRNNLADVSVVLHAAGPFQLTAKPMIEACIAAHTHYLDITGEIPVFEMAKQHNEAALQAGIMIMPGVGFDVVPTDCMALFLKNQLPDAVKLRLAFASVGGSGLSHGTATTMAMGLGEAGAVREDGKIVKKPLGHKGLWIDFSSVNHDQKLFVMTIPWGDIATAYFTTGIPNIETYTGISPKIYRLLKFQGAFNWLLKTRLVRKYAGKKINERPAGPDEAARANSYSLVWGEVQNASSKRVQAMMRTSDGYTLTAHSSLLILQKILTGNVKTGYQTPAAVYGEDLVLGIPGTKRTPAF